MRIYSTYSEGCWILISAIGVIVSIIVFFAVAERFGQSGGFAVGLILLPIVFMAILGFGSAKYTAAA